MVLYGGRGACCWMAEVETVMLLDRIAQRADKLLAESDVEAPAVWGRSGC